MAIQDPYAAAGPKDPYASAGPQDPYANAASPLSSNYKPGHAGVYSFDQLKKLWTDAGGDPAHADIMAHVALAESSGAIDSNENHKTSYDENGKTYFPEGLWQISTVHGLHNMFDPMTNAKEAVALFKDQGLGPWEASRHGGAGGGWGQYLNAQHHDPGQPQLGKPKLKALPPGGMPAVLHSQQHVPVVQQMYEGFLSDFADGMESAVKKVSDFAWSQVQTVRMGNEMQYGDRGRRYRNQTPQQIVQKPLGPPQSAGFPGLPTAPEPPKRVSQAVQSRLSPVIKKIGEAGDVIPEGINAALRLTTGDHSAWDVFNHNYSNPGEMLDAMAPLMLNSPQDIAYWAKQPGLMDKLHEAQPSTGLGWAAKVALGMHADLARLKPGHPYFTGLETSALELANPSWWVAGKLGGAGTHGFFEELQAARLGKYGAKMQGWAKAMADAPMLGNRFVRMGDESGIEGENYHATLARNKSAVWPEATGTFTSADTFGGLNREQQIHFAHVIEHPEGAVDPLGMPVERDPRVAKWAQEKVNGLTYDERAASYLARVRQTEADLKAVSPEMAKRLMQGEYMSHEGAWKTQLPEGPDVRRSGGAQPFQSGRLVPTLLDGLDHGLEMDETWLPSAAAVLHEGKMRDFITFMRGLRGLETLPMGKAMHSFNILYVAPMDARAFDEAVRTGSGYTGSLQHLGEGREGYDAMLEAADKYAATRAQERMAQEGLDESHLPKLNASAKAAYIARVRKIFNDKFPKHVFDAADFLGAPDIRGKAVSKAGTDMMIDVSSQLSKLYGGRAKDFETWLRENPEDVQKYLADPSATAAHDDAPEPSSPAVRWLDAINGAVRQGQVLGVGYHGIFNLAPNAATRMPFKWWPKLATALGFNPRDDIPQAWMEALDKTGAVQKGIGGIGGVPTERLAEMLTVPYKDFVKPSVASKYDELLGKLPADERPMEPDWAARAEKAYVQASRWSQNIAFHYQERRIAAVLYHYLRTGEKMSDSAAAREVSKILNDSHNLTRGLERDHIRHWVYFYGWVRRGLRLATRTALEEPRKIMAPLRGVQTANDLQGDQGSTSGAGLSLRAFGNAVEKLTGIKGLGTDEHGNPRYVDIPSFWSFGSTMARFLGGDATSIAQRAVGNLTPAAGLPLRAAITQFAPDAAMPEPYNYVLWDRDAPNTATKFLQFARSVGGEYGPITLRSDTGGIGPSTFSEPNSSKITKAQNGALMDMRRALVGANQVGDHHLASEIYEQMEAVSSGDASALARSRANIARWDGKLRIRRFRRRGFGVPRY